MLEPFGVPMTGMINSISYTLWADRMLILGIVVLRGNPSHRTHRLCCPLSCTGRQKLPVRCRPPIRRWAGAKRTAGFGLRPEWLERRQRGRQLPIRIRATPAFQTAYYANRTKDIFGAQVLGMDP